VAYTNGGMCVERVLVTGTGDYVIDTGSFTPTGWRIEALGAGGADLDTTNDTWDQNGILGRGVGIGDFTDSASVTHNCSTTGATNRYQRATGSSTLPKMGANAYDSTFAATISASGTEATISVTSHTYDVVLLVTLYGYNCKLEIFDMPTATGTVVYTCSAFDAGGGVYVARGRCDTIGNSNNRGACEGWIAGTGTVNAFFAAVGNGRNTSYQDYTRTRFGSYYSSGGKNEGTSSIDVNGDLEVIWSAVNSGNVANNEGFAVLFFDSAEVDVVRTNVSLYPSGVTGIQSLTWNNSPTVNSIDGYHYQGITSTWNGANTNWVCNINGVEGAGYISSHTSMWEAGGINPRIKHRDHTSAIVQGNTASSTTAVHEGAVQFDGTDMETDWTASSTAGRNYGGMFAFVNSSVGGDSCIYYKNYGYLPQSIKVNGQCYTLSSQVPDEGQDFVTASNEFSSCEECDTGVPQVPAPSPSAAPTSYPQSSPNFSAAPTSYPESSPSATPTLVQITSDASLIDEAVTDLYFDLSLIPASDSFWSTVSEDGGNIRIAHESTPDTYLAFEVVGFDKAAKTGSLFFDSSANISTVTDQTWIIKTPAGLTMPAASDSIGRENVWDSSYIGVWHLSDDASASAPQFADSTSNNNDGTKVSTITNESGQLGDSVELSSGYITVSGLNSQTWSNFTCSWWLKRDAVTSSWMDCISMRGRPHSIWLYSDGDIGYGDSASGPWTRDGDAITSGNWHFCGVKSTNSGSTTGTFYIDGVNKGTGTGNVDSVSPFSSVTFGQGLVYAFKGNMQEIRFSDALRSDNWFSTHYDNQNDNAAFWTVS
jgi:hypothetical protein